MGLTNNDIMKKLRVAHKFRDTDIVEICKLVDFEISTSELGALFRAEDHEKFMPCGDQILRNFLNGLVIHLRGPREPRAPKETNSSLNDEDRGSARRTPGVPDRRPDKRPRMKK